MEVMIERRVRFGDTDPYGVLFFSVLMNYFKECVDEYFREHGFSPDEVYRNRSEGFGLPIVHAEADYRSPVRYDDLLRVTCSVGSVNNKSVTFTCSAESSGTIAGEGKLIFSSISSEWKSIDLPDRIRGLFSKRN